ncbi:hypothetical protein BS47DRAFT_1366411 [Hydnum rufescens UP504]|uniref:Uncharacterized protein n=1 Tax=Hydnum rufescens UP504 TaxID=1448309 RepID=A0A9P6AKZ9_9AGAM|nr:hypothetical protein BS47DRAFT_1366411 [Hydnum rufescens UP504]
MKGSKVVTGQVAQSLPKERKGGLGSKGAVPKPGKGLVLMATRGQLDIQIEAEAEAEYHGFSLGDEDLGKDPLMSETSHEQFCGTSNSEAVATTLPQAGILPD